MWTYLFKRILQAIPVIFVVVTLTFILMKMAPGGPFSAEKKLPKQTIESLNKYYHLDQPLYQQYLDYVGRVATGDLGPSFKYPGRTVNELIADGFPVTAELGIYALIVAVLLGTTAGVIASLKPNSLQDYIPMSFAMIGICMPTMLLGPLLVLIFAVHLEWLPVSGWDSPIDKILPALTLGGYTAATIARLSRGGMLDVMSQDFIRTARAKGLKEKVVVLRHALKGGILPVISYLGPATAGLLSGSFVVETVFQIPGLGRFFVMAGFNRDYTMIIGTTVFLALLIIVFNLISDTVSILLNPRLSFRKG